MDLLIVLFVPAPLLVGVELNPGPKKILSEWTRSQIVSFVNEAGKSIREATRHFKVKRNTVKDILRKAKETGSVANRPGQGRKRKLSPKDREKVLKRAKRDQDSPQIARAMSQKLQQPISTRTIQRTLQHSPLKYLVIEEEIKLTPENKAKRVKFARNYADYDWKFCLFSDEKTFEVGGGARALDGSQET
jgi:transposase